jgi:hypothetical protein
LIRFKTNNINPGASFPDTYPRSERTGDGLITTTRGDFIPPAVDKVLFINFPTESLSQDILSTFTVEARRTDNTIGDDYSGSVTLEIFSGTGSISGTTTRPFISGVATFDDIVITGSGAHVIDAISSGLTKDSESIEVYASEQDVIDLGPQQFISALNEDDLTYSDGTNISVWDSKVGAGISQNNASYQPTYNDIFKGVYFPADHKYMFNYTSGGSGGTTMYILSTTEHQYHQDPNFYYTRRFGTQERWNNGSSPTSSRLGVRINNTWHFGLDVPFFRRKLHKIVVNDAATEAKLYTDGVLENTVPITSLADVYPAYVGGRYSSTDYNGLLHLGLTFNRELTAEEQATVESYIDKAWSEADRVIALFPNPLTATEETAIRTFILAEISNGNWWKYDEFQCYGLSDQANALTSWFGHSGGQTYDPQGGGTLSKTSEGFTNTGVKGGINTRFNAAGSQAFRFKENSCVIGGFYSNVSNDQSAGDNTYFLHNGRDYIWQPTGATSRPTFWLAGDQSRNYSGQNLNVLSPRSNYVEFDGANYRWYRNGSNMGDRTAGQGTIHNGQFKLGCNSNGLYSIKGNYSSFFAGRQLVSHSGHYTNLKNLLTSLGVTT